MLEIESQPDVWPGALEAGRSIAYVLQGMIPSHGVRFVGCGSTFYLAQAMSRSWEALTGVPARATPGSILWLQDTEHRVTVKNEMLVAISRSGRTSETLSAIDRHVELGGGPVAAVTCSENTPLHEISDAVITLSAAREVSVAQTRAFTSMYLALLGAAAELGEHNRLAASLDALPAHGRSIIQSAPDVLGGYTDRDVDRVYVLGDGVANALAREAALKVKEVALTHSEAFHVLEFRHGPMSMVTASTLIVGFITHQSTRSGFETLRELLGQAAALGGHTVEISVSSRDLRIDGSLPPAAADILYLLPMQVYAVLRAEAKNIDPDRPRNLSSYVELPGVRR